MVEDANRKNEIETAGLERQSAYVGLGNPDIGPVGEISLRGFHGVAQVNPDDVTAPATDDFGIAPRSYTGIKNQPPAQLIGCETRLRLELSLRQGVRSVGIELGIPVNVPLEAEGPNVIVGCDETSLTTGKGRLPPTNLSESSDNDVRVSGSHNMGKTRAAIGFALIAALPLRCSDDHWFGDRNCPTPKKTPLFPDEHSVLDLWSECRAGSHEQARVDGHLRKSAASNGFPGQKEGSA
jgi:hypothetical protein